MQVEKLLDRFVSMLLLHELELFEQIGISLFIWGCSFAETIYHLTHHDLNPCLNVSSEGFNHHRILAKSLLDRHNLRVIVPKLDETLSIFVAAVQKAMQYLFRTVLYSRPS